MAEVSFVLIDMSNVPRPGDAQMIIRIRQEDREAVDLAAQALGMKQAEFLRTAAINVAKKVIAENAR